MGIISKYFEYLYNYNKDTHIMIMEQIDMHLGEVMQSMDEYSNVEDPEMRQLYYNSAVRTIYSFYKMYQQGLKHDRYDVYASYEFKHVNIEEVENLLREYNYLDAKNIQK